MTAAAASMPRAGHSLLGAYGIPGSNAGVSGTSTATSVSCGPRIPQYERLHRGLSLPVRGWRRRRDDWFERGDQRGQVFRDDLPHDVFVNAEVIVNDLVAHADDVGPRDLGVLVRELSGHLARSFTDDLNEMSQCEAKILVRVVRTAREALGSC
jgi:hypothetical protein